MFRSCTCIDVELCGASLPRFLVTKHRCSGEHDITCLVTFLPVSGNYLRDFLVSLHTISGEDPLDSPVKIGQD